MLADGQEIVEGAGQAAERAGIYRPAHRPKGEKVRFEQDPPAFPLAEGREGIVWKLTRASPSPPGRDAGAGAAIGDKRGNDTTAQRGKALLRTTSRVSISPLRREGGASLGG